MNIYKKRKIIYDRIIRTITLVKGGKCMKKRRVWWGMLALFMLCLSIGVHGQGRYVMIEGVPTINQHPNMPTGCEVTALTMLLRYYGIDVSKEQLGKDMP